MAAICIVKTHSAMNKLVIKASTTTAADSTFGFFGEKSLSFHVNRLHQITGKDLKLSFG